MSYRIGLTGGIGSGKSTVATLFAEHGITVVDSDVISHQLTRPGGAAMEAIRSTFGADYIDSSGALNRTRMRQLVFSDVSAKQNLEAILHPLIRAQMLAEVSDSPYLLLVIPLLFETENYLEQLQRILVVDCAETLQISRAMQRSGLAKNEVRAIMAQQVSREQRLQRADDVLTNDRDLGTLRQQVAQLHQQYINFSAGSD